MKKTLLIVVSGFNLLFSNPPDTTRQWNLIWCDEFRDNNLDTSWIIDTMPWNMGYNARSNVKVDSGNLIIESYLDSSYRKRSGYISNTREFKYGFFEIKCSYDLTMWPCFWLLPPNVSSLRYVDINKDEAKTSGTEIDIMEHYNSRTSHQANIWHYSPTLIEDFACQTYSISSQNVYGLEWGPTYYKFYVNGELKGTIDTHVSHQPQFVIVSSEPGPGPTGDYSSRVDYTGHYKENPLSFKVDYVRVWYPTNGYSEPDTKGDVSTIINSYIIF
jgi:beta-glucanase (GH16 family)